MSSKSDYFEDGFLDQWLGDVAFSVPNPVYIALFTDDPGEAGSLADEVVGGSYARVSVTNDLTNWPAAVSGVKSNGTAVTFPMATAAWGTITHFAIMDAATSGNILWYAPLDDPRDILTGDQPNFAVGTIVITEE